MTLKQEKIDLISLEEQLDTSSAAGELVFHVGEDDRSVTLDYELKGSVRGARKVAKRLWKLPPKNRATKAGRKWEVPNNP